MNHEGQIVILQREIQELRDRLDRLESSIQAEKDAEAATLAKVSQMLGGMNLPQEAA